VASLKGHHRALLFCTVKSEQPLASIPGHSMGFPARNAVADADADTA